MSKKNLNGPAHGVAAAEPAAPTIAGNPANKLTFDRAFLQARHQEYVTQEGFHRKQAGNHTTQADRFAGAAGVIAGMLEQLTQAENAAIAAAAQPGPPTEDAEEARDVTGR
jgi:hypothetical protein